MTLCTQKYKQVEEKILVGMTDATMQVRMDVGQGLVDVNGVWGSLGAPRKQSPSARQPFRRRVKLQKLGC